MKSPHLSGGSCIDVEHGITVVVDNNITIISDVYYHSNRVYELYRGEEEEVG